MQALLLPGVVLLVIILRRPFLLLRLVAVEMYVLVFVLDLSGDDDHVVSF